MKGFKTLSFGKSLSREEMKDISGGFFGGTSGGFDGGGVCQSDCSPTGPNTCATPDCPNSYCAQLSCHVTETLIVRRNSCQYQ